VGRRAAASSLRFVHHKSVPAPFRSNGSRRAAARVAASSRAFVACEPRRSATRAHRSRLVALLGANQITRGGRVKSVAAGFAGLELSSAWRSAAGRLDRRGVLAAPFTHCFTAVRARRANWRGSWTLTATRSSIGAGPAGTAAAILLAKAGWRVTIVEQHHTRAAKSVASASPPAISTLLDELGVGTCISRGGGTRTARSRLDGRGGDRDPPRCHIVQRITYRGTAARSGAICSTPNCWRVRGRSACAVLQPARVRSVRGGWGIRVRD
jgi:hypothetical protein